MRKLRLRWGRRPIRTSEGELTRRSKKLKHKTDFFEEDRLPTRSTNISGLLALTKPPPIPQTPSSVSLQGDDIGDFDTRGDEALLSASERPKDNVLEGLGKMRIRESVQLQTVDAMNEQQIDQNRAMPNYQKLKTMLRIHIDQTIRTRNSKREKCQRWQEIMRILPEESKTTATEIISVDRQHNRPLLIQGRRHRMTEEDLLNETLLREVKDRAIITLKENCTNPSCAYWPPPACQNYKTESGFKFGDECLVRHAETDSQPSKKSKKSCGKRSVAFLKKSKHLDTCSRTQSRRNRSRFYGRAPNIWIRSHRPLLERHVTTP